jgi:ATP-dependent DNA ligase
MVLVLFDLLHLRGKSVMRELWRDRRTHLEDLLDGRQLPRVAVVPVTDDAPTLYETWVGMGACALLSKFADAWARSVRRGARAW